MLSKNRLVIILIGPPGSGKGTQAELLAKKFNLVHFETSKVLEKKLKKIDPKDKELVKAKKLYDAGKLVTPKLVAKIVIKEIEDVYKKGKGINFSGSPRTLFEAKKEMPLLEKLYGKENIKIFYLKISQKESVKRNSVRKICKKNRHPIPFTLPEYKNIKKCPWDGSEIITRSLDKPEIIKKRYKVFLKDTKPVISYLKEKGYKVYNIKGEQPIEKVFNDILSKMS